MILDASVILAILFQEPGYEELARKLVEGPQLGIGAPTLAECGIVLSARLGQDARGLLARFIAEANITVIPFTAAHYGASVGAWIRYGKGRHAAQLNFGDCLAYATAKVAGLPLLAIGDDFPRTDIERA